MEGDGSRVTFLACSWIPRVAEEPGKETEKVTPLPLPVGLWDWKSSFLHQHLLSPLGGKRLNPSGAGIREDRAIQMCTQVLVGVAQMLCPAQVGPSTCLAALLNTLTWES